MFNKKILYFRLISHLQSLTPIIALKTHIIGYEVYWINDDRFIVPMNSEYYSTIENFKHRYTHDYQWDDVVEMTDEEVFLYFL